MHLDLKISSAARLMPLRRQAHTEQSHILDPHQLITQGVQLATESVHSITIGDSELLLDLGSGTGLAVHDDGPPERLDDVERRLVLLDWTRRRMPVMTPTAVWDLEVAGLVAERARPSWNAAIAGPTIRALDHVIGSSIDLTSEAVVLLSGARRRLDARAELDRPLWSKLLDAVTAALLTHAPELDLAILPMLTAVRGSAEPEWDRLPWFAVDVREHAVRSRVAGSVWTASIASQRPPLPGSVPDQLVARLVDVDTGEVLDAGELSWTDGMYAGRGRIPLRAADRELRVDVTHHPDVPARTGDQHRWVLRQQAVFRTLLFERLATVDPKWQTWATEQRRESSFRPPGLGAQPPFIAERLLRPEQLSSSRLKPNPRSGGVTRGRRRTASSRVKRSPKEGPQ